MLQTAPEMFAFEEFPVCEVKLNTDVHFPGAGCLVVSCKTDPRVGKKEWVIYMYKIVTYYNMFYNIVKIQ